MLATFAVGAIWLSVRDAPPAAGAGDYLALAAQGMLSQALGAVGVAIGAIVRNQVPRCWAC